MKPPTPLASTIPGWGSGLSWVTAVLSAPPPCLSGPGVLLIHRPRPRGLSPSCPARRKSEAKLCPHPLRAAPTQPPTGHTSPNTPTYSDAQPHTHRHTCAHTHIHTRPHMTSHTQTHTHTHSAYLSVSLTLGLTLHFFRILYVKRFFYIVLFPPSTPNTLYFGAILVIKYLSSWCLLPRNVTELKLWGARQGARPPTLLPPTNYFLS